MDDRAFWKSCLGNLEPGLRDTVIDKGLTELKENTVWKKNGLETSIPLTDRPVCFVSLESL